jgi:Amidohydrolase family
VPHELPDEMIDAIVSRGIWVTPTLAGSAYSVMRLLRDPELLHREDDLVTNVQVGVRRDLYLVLRLLRLPGVARLLLRHRDPIGRLESWYEHSLANTGKLYAAGVNLAFGTDTPFAFGNFHHGVMNEARALREAGVPNEAILRMATAGSATALGISDDVGRLLPGMRADCVLLQGDPLADIEALSRVSLVVKEGRVVYQ